MHTFAWIGVIAAGLLITAYLAVWLWMLISNEIGRAILLRLGILAVILWGIGGGIYLIAAGR